MSWFHSSHSSSQVPSSAPPPQLEVSRAPPDQHSLQPAERAHHDTSTTAFSTQQRATNKQESRCSSSEVSPFKWIDPKKRKLQKPRFIAFPSFLETDVSQGSRPESSRLKSVASTQNRLPARRDCPASAKILNRLSSSTFHRGNDGEHIIRETADLPHVSVSGAIPRNRANSPELSSAQDIDIPSPPSLTSSDDNEPEAEKKEQISKPNTELSCINQFLKGKERKLHNLNKDPRGSQPLQVTDTCEPLVSSQDSAPVTIMVDQNRCTNFRIEDDVETGDNLKTDADEGSAGTNHSPRKQYYARAFDYVVREVVKRYHCILPSEDVDVVTVLRDRISANGFALFVRIYRRKQPAWYRLTSLKQSYSSDLNVSDGILELCREHLLISSVHAMEGSSKVLLLLARELLSTLGLLEIRSVCSSISEGSSLKRLPRNRILPALRKLLSESSASGGSRGKLRQTTLTGLKPAHCLARSILKLAGHSVRIPDSVLASLQRLHFLFFLEEGHDAPNVILADTGKMKFPEYECCPSRGVFQSFHTLQAYESAINIERFVNEALERKDWAQAAHFGSLAELEVRELNSFASTSGKDTARGPEDEVCIFEKDLRSVDRVYSSNRSRMEKNMQLKDQLEQLRHPLFRRYTAQWVYARTCWHSVHALERMSEYESAVSRLRLLLATDLMPKRKGKCLTRLTINLFRHMSRLEEALQIIVSALSDEGCYLQYGDRRGLAQRGVHIYKKLLSKGGQGDNHVQKVKAGKRKRECIPDRSVNWSEAVETALKVETTSIPVRKIYGKSLNVQQKEDIENSRHADVLWGLRINERSHRLSSSGPGNVMSLMGRAIFASHGRSGRHLSVEEYCLEWYFGKQAWNGVHDEGKSIRFVFSLLMWECALFASVPDVFQTPYQDRPLDLHTEAFYSSRKGRIDSRLEDIGSLSPEEIYNEITQAYAKFEGMRAVGCHWNAFTSDAIASIAAGLGASAIATCCKLLAQDYSYWAGGLPDLTLWKTTNGETTAASETKLVEVKSARDSLSDRQKAWLVALRSEDVDCEVCKVVERATAKNLKDLNEAKLSLVAIDAIDAMEQVNEVS